MDRHSSFSLQVLDVRSTGVAAPVPSEHSLVRQSNYPTFMTLVASPRIVSQFWATSRTMFMFLFYHSPYGNRETISDVIKSVDMDVLCTVWDETALRRDVCRITSGKNIAHLPTNVAILGHICGPICFQICDLYKQLLVC